MLIPDHIVKGLVLGIRHRRELATLLRSTSPGFSTLDLEPARLHSEGIKVLALDFDGVLATHGAECPLDVMTAWLDRCVAIFGSDKIFILSNKPTAIRNNWFTERFPGIRFISGVRKKPYPDGLKTIGELSRVPPETILMVDDRLLTGCLAAILYGARPSYIRKPFASLSGDNAVPEFFFMLLRLAERVLIRCCSR